VPELPEVETVRRGLSPYVSGRTIETVEVLNPRAVRKYAGGGAAFAQALAGRRLICASRRGKYLWFPLDGRDEAMVAHLGMSGQIVLETPEVPDGPHLRIRMHLAEAERQVRFVDQRTFGGFDLDDLVDDGDGGRVPASVAHIGRDYLDPVFDASAWSLELRRKHTGLKRALLDQTLASGIGNIYADEALWRARLHWAQPTETLSRPRTLELLRHVTDVLAEATAQGGTSFDDLYVDVNGQSGWFERELRAYGRESDPCDRCGTQIVREAWENRSSYRCPHCQRTPRGGGRRGSRDAQVG
jgi:formamidopyrimidine-DNA glycosylase